MSSSLYLILVCKFVSFLLFLPDASAFILPNFQSAFLNKDESRCLATQTTMSMSSDNFGEATGLLRESLKKMRGISVSVEYKSSTSTSSMEMEILSQELRKAKAASIWTSSLDVIEQFAKEQSTAKGNFPGPSPVIYMGDDTATAIKKGATAVVLNVEDIPSIVDNGIDVDVICKASTVEEITQANEAGFQYAFLIPGCETELSQEDLEKMLASIPKTSIVISTLPSMQADSAEIARGKELATITIPDGAKINGLLIQGACVGDGEDLKYTSFVVENINKKSSSTFSMTGLTGSANGHFGSDLSGGLKKAKWQRIAATK